MSTIKEHAGRYLHVGDLAAAGPNGGKHPGGAPPLRLRA